MSGTGPASIPTSADPRSKRPVKKRALTPLSAQAANLDALFAKPDQEIRVPTGPLKPRVAAPPEIVTNVQGSSAGAGSGEFHVYKAARRREYERLRIMDNELQKEKDTEDFEAAKKGQDAKDDEKTRRNREKRDKAKARKAKAKSAAGKGAGANGTKMDVDKGESGKSPNGVEDDSSATKNGEQLTRSKAAEEPGLVIHDDD